jgi:AraC-like DNA-binding protein
VLPAQARQGLAFACRFAAEWYLKGRGPAADDLEALKPLLARRVPWRMERFAEARRERLLWWAAQSQGLASWDVRDFGLKRLPGAVLAFLPAVSGSDAIQDLLLAARLRQAAFHLAVERGYIAGRALGEGACLLVPAEAKGRRSNEALAELGRDTASWLGRKLGVPVCAAWSLALGGEYLPEAFRQAEWALLTGLAAGRRLSPYGSGHGGGADPVLDSYEAGKALEQAVVSGRTAELNAAKEAALGSAGRLFPGRSDLLRPELLRLSLQLFDAVKRRGLLEGPAFETQRREALASLQKAHNTRELAGAFSNLVDKLGLLAVSPRSGSSRLRVRQVQRTLDEEELPPALTAAARLAGLSASRFSRLYSRESGEGYGAQRRRKRLAVAAQLLLQGRLPIWRVAHESGYRSPSHFVQAFKRAYGKTPADYRREAQEKG